MWEFFVATRPGTFSAEQAAPLQRELRACVARAAQRELMRFTAAHPGAERLGAAPEAAVTTAAAYGVAAGTSTRFELFLNRTETELDERLLFDELATEVNALGFDTRRVPVRARIDSRFLPVALRSGGDGDGSAGRIVVYAGYDDDVAADDVVRAARDTLGDALPAGAQPTFTHCTQWWSGHMAGECRVLVVEVPVAAADIATAFAEPALTALQRKLGVLAGLLRQCVIKALAVHER